ncbi:MAG: hypothetical protein KDJ65_12835 [Anaerolineae bacterium]|nr:hypothetical protein [Anaerolineae bacterium]
MNNPPTILIIGADGYGQVVADILLAQPCRPAGKMRPVGFIDDNSNRHNNHFAKLPTLGTLRDLALIPHDGVIVAVEHNQARQQLIERLLWQGEWLVTIIHPAAVIGTGVTVGAGTIIGPGAVVNTGVGIGRGVIIKANSTIDHHTWLGDFVSVGPGAQLCAHGRIGPGTIIGAAAIVTPGRHIAARSMVPPGCIVNHDVGMPAYLLAG